MKGYIWGNNGLYQETVDDLIIGEGSNWIEGLPLGTNENFYCRWTPQPEEGWVFNKKYCRWDPPSS
jgi:hypothetical protein